MNGPLTPRDQRYLNCTSFEVYIATGLVFLAGFTLSFVLSVIYHAEPMLWPASLVVVGICSGVFFALRHRERKAKLREIQKDYEAQ